MIFFFNDTATTEIYTLSLHDALPILKTVVCRSGERKCKFCHKAPPRLEGIPAKCSRPDRLNADVLLINSAIVTPLSAVSKTRSEEHTSELQSPDHLVCRLLLEKKNIH